MASALEVLHRTESVCPECFARLPAAYVVKDGAVHLERACPDHGTFAPRVWDDAEAFRRFTALFPSAATSDSPFAVRNAHACVCVVDVTDRCNLTCSYCFASSTPQLKDKPLSDVRHLLDVIVDSGGPRPVQLSGGEPTVRDDLLDVLRYAKERGFTHLEVNTNGVRLATEDGYAAALKAAGASVVYLQFDGVEPAIHEAIRAADLTAVKAKAVAACRAAGLPVLLVATVVPGVNDHELGAIVQFGLANADVVRGVNLQPVSHFGRYAADTGNLSIDKIAALVAAQVPGMTTQDFLPVPCCSALCQASALMLRTPAGPVPLTRFVSADLYQRLAAAVNEDDYLDVFAKTPRGADRAAALAEACCVPLPGAAKAVFERTFPVSITAFMDADTVDMRRIGNCCIGVPTADHGVVPFCAYNLTDRRGRYAFRTAAGWGGLERSG